VDTIIRDRNMVTGFFAATLGFAGADELADELASSNDDLSQSLLLRNVVSQTEYKLLNDVVDQYIKRLEHNVSGGLMDSGRAAADFVSRASSDSHSKSLESTLPLRHHPGKRGPQRFTPVTSHTSRYRVLHAHAKGGLGSVSVAEDLELGRRVALKEIQERYADDDSSRRRFVREAEITGGLEHPGIVPVYGLGAYADGRPYYAMRFIQGMTLDQAIAGFHAQRSVDAAEQHLAFRQLLQRFLDVCHAVAYAHSRGVLHRDLKPGNVMLGPFGETLVVDWGLAKSFNATEAESSNQLSSAAVDQDTATRVGEILGTPAFMSPEQAAGHVDRLTPASDVFSLGAILYVLLTGERPFRGLDQDRNGLDRFNRFRQPSHVSPGIPAALNAICCRAMARQPEQRYPDAMKLGADIEHWLGDEPVSAHRERIVDKLARWSRRHRTAVATTAALIMTSTVALAGGLWAVSAEQTRTAKERDEKEAARGDAVAAQLDAERSERRTREALAAVTDQALAPLMTRQVRLGELERNFVTHIAELHDEFIAHKGDSEINRATRAEAHARLGRLQLLLENGEQAEESLRRALDEFRVLLTESPANIAFARNNADVTVHLAEWLTMSGRSTEAIELLRQAIHDQSSLETKLPSQAIFHTIQVRARLALAEALDSAGDLPNAELELQRALDESAMLRREAQQDEKTFHYSSVSSGMMGRMMLRRGDEQKALALFREAADFQRQARDLVPHDPHQQLSYAQSMNNLATYQEKAGDLDEATASFQIGITQLEKLVAEYPGALDYQVSLAFSLSNQTIILRRTNRLAEAIAADQQAIAIMNSLRVICPARTDIRFSRAQMLANHASFLTERGEVTQATELLRDAVAEYVDLSKVSPGNESIQISRAHALNVLAVIHSDLGEHAEAELRLTDAIDTIDVLIQAHPDNFSLRESIAIELLNRSRARAAQGKILAAASDATRAGTEQAVALRLQPTSASQNLHSGASQILHFLKHGTSIRLNSRQP